MLSCCNNAPHCSLQPTPRCAALPAQRRSRIPPISGFRCRCGKHQGRCVEIEFWQCLQSCDAATVGGVPGAVVVAARWRRAARREARRRRLCLWPCARGSTTRAAEGACQESQGHRVSIVDCVSGSISVKVIESLGHGHRWAQQTTGPYLEIVRIMKACKFTRTRTLW